MKRVRESRERWRDRERERICSFRYHLKRVRRGYKPADVSHYYQDFFQVPTKLYHSKYMAKGKRHFHRQKWALKSVSAIVTITV